MKYKIKKTMLYLIMSLFIVVAFANASLTITDTGLNAMESGLLGIGIIAGILVGLMGLMNGFTVTSLITLLVGLIIFMVSLQFIH